MTARGFTLLHEGDHTNVTAKLVEHEVLAMQDVDPQMVTPLRIFSSEIAPEQFSVKVPDGKTIELVPGPIVLPPGLDGQVRVMTSTSKSVTSDNGNPATSSFESQYSDGKHQLIMVRKGADHVLTIKDGDGKQLFEGPVDTADQQKNIPADLQPTFHEMQKMQHMSEDGVKP